jgi:membrane-associated protein
MEWLTQLIDVVLHLNQHVSALLDTYHVWFYGILFAVIFAETGFVVTPFLPGDSLLFAVGALTAIDTSGTLSLPLLLVMLIVAAVLGNAVNYQIGRFIGPVAFSGRYRFLKLDYLKRTEAFFQRHGGMAVVLSRFVPIVRTFAPFVAGVGKMNWGRYQAYNVAGGSGWVLLMTVAGYLFGNVPFVKNNFGLVTIAIIIASILPLIWVLWRDRAAAGPAGVS